MNLYVVHNIIATILGIFSNFRLAIAFENFKKFNDSSYDSFTTAIHAF